MRGPWTLAADGCDRATAYHMSNKIIRRGDELLATWLDSRYRNVVASVDQASGEVVSRSLVSQGFDNHCGAAMTLTPDDVVHVMSGSHHRGFVYRCSSNPADPSSWSLPEGVGCRATYPSLISDLDGVADPTSELDAVKIVALPPDAAGAGPWPDGVERVALPGGGEVFAVAGEWNDTFMVVDPAGQVLANHPISPADLPAALPRVVDEGSPLFSPDSIAAFVVDGSPHVAITLRHAGAVVVYDLTDPAAPVYASAVAVGKNESGGQDEDGSSIRPEGIAAAADGAWIVTANEEESSVSLSVAR